MFYLTETHSYISQRRHICRKLVVVGVPSFLVLKNNVAGQHFWLLQLVFGRLTEVGAISADAIDPSLKACASENSNCTFVLILSRAETPVQLASPWDLLLQEQRKSSDEFDIRRMKDAITATAQPRQRLHSNI